MNDWNPKIASTSVFNERVKAISGLLFNLGGALVAATAVRLYSDAGLNSATMVWSSGASAIIYFGWLVLSLLVEEDDGEQQHVR